MYLLPALLTPLPFIPSITEEITDCTNEVAKGANNAPGNSSFWFIILSFAVSVTPSINTPESSNDFKF